MWPGGSGLSSLSSFGAAADIGTAAASSCDVLAAATAGSSDGAGSSVGDGAATSAACSEASRAFLALGGSGSSPKAASFSAMSVNFRALSADRAMASAERATEPVADAASAATAAAACTLDTSPDAQRRSHSTPRVSARAAMLSTPIGELR